MNILITNTVRSSLLIKYRLNRKNVYCEPMRYNNAMLLNQINITVVSNGSEIYDIQQPMEAN